MQPKATKPAAAPCRSSAPITSTISSSSYSTSDIMGSNGQFEALYRSRLHIDPSEPLPPDDETLKYIVERHLAYVPFENLSLHGAGTGTGGCCSAGSSSSSLPGNRNEEEPIPLQLSTLITKILIRRRGGCCFELNGLLGSFLQTLGYHSVRLVPCWVYAGPERGHCRSKKSKFRTRQSHCFLWVKCRQRSCSRSSSCGVDKKDHNGGGPRNRIDCDADVVADGEGNGMDNTSSVTVHDEGGTGKDEMETYILDVGLGEPPLHPLRYSRDSLGIEQITPEWMKSRIVREGREWTDGDGKVRKCCILEWWKPCRACCVAASAAAAATESAFASSDNASDRGDGVVAQQRNNPTTAAAATMRARDLRARAIKARRKSMAKPRPPFKMFAADVVVREEARRRVLLKRQRERQEPFDNDLSETGGASLAAAPADRNDDDCDDDDEFDLKTVVHREVCTMWSSIPITDRVAYQEQALKEIELRKEETDRAEQEAALAERDAAAAAAAKLMDDERSGLAAGGDRHHQDGNLRCDERCDGAGGYWEPRLQWDIGDAPFDSTTADDDDDEKDWFFVDDAALASFANAVKIISGEGSTFVRKAVACIATRTAKVTLAGSRLKITTPRFPPVDLTTAKYRTKEGNCDDCQWPVQTCTELESLEEVRAVLLEKFGIAMEETNGLNLSVESKASKDSAAELWYHL